MLQDGSRELQTNRINTARRRYKMKSLGQPGLGSKPEKNVTNFFLGDLKLKWVI